ncbi:hypothetical protein [uncultured Jatrophihabitans sp.]|uniref:hypothetical protein n=1 Tax=uncultured Jatrophihabitans sp. TaxID=1610747 RepID=UPI0035CB15A7
MSEPRPGRRSALTRADLPDEFTVDTVRDLPLATLRRLADRRNGVLNEEEQQAFDRAVHEVMGAAAQRVSRQFTNADWSARQRKRSARGARSGRASSGADKQLDRIARRIGQQIDVAEALAPGVDWSFAQPTQPPDDTAAPQADSAAPTDVPADSGDTAQSTDDSTGTVSDLEQRISDQVELVEVMSEIADVSRRTFGLEQDRDLQNTRTVFFGFVVSVAVLVAGWAPLVAARDWTERSWIIGLTVGTCAIGAGVYGLVRIRQNREEATDQKADDSS